MVLWKDHKNTTVQGGKQDKKEIENNKKRGDSIEKRRAQRNRKGNLRPNGHRDSPKRKTGLLVLTKVTKHPRKRYGHLSGKREKDYLDSGEGGRRWWECKEWVKKTSPKRWG